MKTTEIINHFDLPSELKTVTGTFRYRYFEPLEKTEEDSRFAEDSSSWPRYTLIEWEGESEPLPISMQGQDVIHRESLFFPSDLNSGFTSLKQTETWQLEDFFSALGAVACILYLFGRLSAFVRLYTNTYVLLHRHVVQRTLPQTRVNCEAQRNSPRVR